VAVAFHDVGVEIQTETRAEFSCARPAASQVWHRIDIRRPDGQARIMCTATLSQSDAGLQTTGDLLAAWNGESVAHRRAAVTIPMRRGRRRPASQETDPPM